MNDAQLLETVASSVARAVLAASGDTRLTPPKTPTTPTTPKPERTQPVRPKPPRRAPGDRDRLPIAIHEAGHAVAGVVLGAELRSAILAPEGIKLPGGRAGQTNFKDQAAYHDPQVAYAGPWAQAKFTAGGCRPTLRQFYAILDGTGHNDRQVLTAAGGTHEGAGVVPMLDRCWPAVLTVARKLHSLGEVHQEDVLAALGITDGGGQFSVQLASLRSGCRSVPAFVVSTA